MTKEEMLEKIYEIDSQLNDLKQIYEPYVGRTFDSLSEEESKVVLNVIGSVTKLFCARNQLRMDLIQDFKIFII